LRILAFRHDRRAGKSSVGTKSQIAGKDRRNSVPLSDWPPPKGRFTSAKTKSPFHPDGIQDAATVGKRLVEDIKIRTVCRQGASLEVSETQHPATSGFDPNLISSATCVECPGTRSNPADRSDHFQSSRRLFEPSLPPNGISQQHVPDFNDPPRTKQVFLLNDPARPRWAFFGVISARDAFPPALFPVDATRHRVQGSWKRRRTSSRVRLQMADPGW